MTSLVGAIIEKRRRVRIFTLVRLEWCPSYLIPGADEEDED